VGVDPGVIRLLIAQTRIRSLRSHMTTADLARLAVRPCGSRPDGRRQRCERPQRPCGVLRPRREEMLAERRRLASGDADGFCDASEGHVVDATQRGFSLEVDDELI
jgi:hypothetical protein